MSTTDQTEIPTQALKTRLKTLEELLSGNVDAVEVDQMRAEVDEIKAEIAKRKEDPSPEPGSVEWKKAECERLLADENIPDDDRKQLLRMQEIIGPGAVFKDCHDARSRVVRANSIDDLSAFIQAVLATRSNPEICFDPLISEELLDSVMRLLSLAGAQAMNDFIICGIDLDAHQCQAMPEPFASDQEAVAAFDWFHAFSLIQQDTQL